MNNKGYAKFWVANKVHYGNLQLAYEDCLQRSKCDVTNKEGYEKSLNKRYDPFDKMKMH